MVHNNKKDKIVLYLRTEKRTTHFRIKIGNGGSPIKTEKRTMENLLFFMLCSLNEFNNKKRIILYRRK